MKGPSLAQIARGMKADKGQKREYKQAAEWGRCSATDCPMPGTAKPEGGQEVCSYHLGTDHNYYAEMTEAIEKHKHYHNKLCEMVYWSPATWKYKREAMENWGFCPLEANEVPNMYMNRLRAKLTEAINIMASN